MFDFCLIPLYPMVLIARVFCYFGLGYFSHSCVAYMFGDSAIKWSSCPSYVFLPAFVWDAVYAVPCFLDFIVGFPP
jgi:hypothetical protein